jgi:hypothetical protein
MKARIHIFTKHPNGDLVTLCGRKNAKDNRHVKDARCCKTCDDAAALITQREECGRLRELPSGKYSLEYRVGGKVFRCPLGTSDRKKAETLRPLMMRTIQRTGKPIATGPQCNADLL